MPFFGAEFFEGPYLVELSKVEIFKLHGGRMVDSEALVGV